MNRVTINALVATVLLLFTAGCAIPTISRTTRLTPAPLAAATKEVIVYPKGEPGPSNFEVIGVVTAIQIMVPKNKDTIMMKLKADAAALGADSLVGYYTDSDGSGGIWTTALAVRSLPPGQSPTPRSVAGVVAIPHAFLPKEVATGKRAETLDDVALKLAQYQLVLRGYYPILTDETTPDPFEGSFQSMDAIGLDKYGGSEADLVLGLKFIKNRNVNLALVSYQDMTLEMSLYSKPEKKVAWHQTGVGCFLAGLVQSVEPSEQRIQSTLEPIMEETFNALPSLPK